MHCRSCNTRIGSGSRTCPNCGLAVNVGSLHGKPKEAAGPRKMPLSASTAVDPMEVELDDAVELDQVTASGTRKSASGSRSAASSSGASSSAASSTSTERPARRPGGGIRPEPADVRRMITERPDLLESGLRAYADSKGRKVGAGYSTDVGDIDLLASDDAGSLVVVMVADAGGEKDLVSDMLQRVGWVRKHLGASNQEVRGIALVAPHVEDLSYAAAAVAGTVDFKTYRIALTFDDVDV